MTVGNNYFYSTETFVLVVILVFFVLLWCLFVFYIFALHSPKVTNPVNSVGGFGASFSLDESLYLLFCVCPAMVENDAQFIA